MALHRRRTQGDVFGYLRSCLLILRGRQYGGHRGTSHCALSGSRCLLDRFVGAGEESRRDFEAERLGSLEVDHKIETGRLVKGNFSRSGAFQNLRNLAGDAAIQDTSG
jgi:hypothetical protein